MAPSSQELEPPANPGRFKAARHQATDKHPFACVEAPGSLLFQLPLSRVGYLDGVEVSEDRADFVNFKYKLGHMGMASIGYR
jgi:hypothetical protein